MIYNNKYIFFLLAFFILVLQTNSLPILLVSVKFQQQQQQQLVLLHTRTFDGFTQITAAHSIQSRTPQMLKTSPSKMI